MSSINFLKPSSFDVPFKQKWLRSSKRQLIKYIKRIWLLSIPQLLSIAKIIGMFNPWKSIV